MSTTVRETIGATQSTGTYLEMHREKPNIKDIISGIYEHFKSCKQTDL